MTLLLAPSEWGVGGLQSLQQLSQLEQTGGRKCDRKRIYRMALSHACTKTISGLNAERARELAPVLALSISVCLSAYRLPACLNGVEFFISQIDSIATVEAPARPKRANEQRNTRLLTGSLLTWPSTRDRRPDRQPAGSRGSKRSTPSAGRCARFAGASTCLICCSPLTNDSD